MTGCPLFRGLVAAAILMLSGCTADTHVPPFARVPYEPFSRQAVVAIALREWRAFGSNVALPSTGDKPERADGLWQRIGEYWWLGLDPSDSAASWTGKHDAKGRVFPPERDEAFAWSAAFVSYVMRMAGAGAGFPYAAAHDTYIHAAIRGEPGLVIVAERPDRFAPRPGDLICAGRDDSASLRYDDLATTPLFKAHCDIVVTIGDSADLSAIGDSADLSAIGDSADLSAIGGPAGLAAIGGNVADAVTLRQFPVAPDGRLWPTAPWLVILRLRD